MAKPMLRVSFYMQRLILFDFMAILELEPETFVRFLLRIIILLHYEI